MVSSASLGNVAMRHVEFSTRYRKGHELTREHEARKHRHADWVVQVLLRHRIGLRASRLLVRSGHKE